jgi:Tfp pilus assembly protein PilV
MRVVIEAKEIRGMWSPGKNDGLPRNATLERGSSERGFTLLEAVIGLVLMMIVALGSASLFSFSVYNNSGGSERATSLAIAQQALERLRSATFNSTTTAAGLAGGSITQNGVVRDFRTYTVTVTVDDDPSTWAIEIIPATNFKRITISVTPERIGQGWAFGAGGRVMLITERSRTDR